MRFLGHLTLEDASRGPPNIIERIEYGMIYGEHHHCGLCSGFLEDCSSEVGRSVEVELTLYKLILECRCNS